MSNNIFLKPEAFYQRQINPIAQYVEQGGFYMAKMSGKDIEHCKSLIKESIKGGKFPGARDPRVSFFERGDNGDKFKTDNRLSRYISEVVANDELLAPTFTSYVNSRHKESLLVGFIDANVIRRGKSKKEAFVAKAAGNIDLFLAKDNDQANMKLYNNAMSGTFATKGSILNNSTAHSTLTSLTRSVSSIGNASNEKIISGNRHYRSADIVLNNLISIASSVDREALGDVLNKYRLKYPSAHDVMECISYSTNFYWKDERVMGELYSFVETLDEIERAAIVYSGDFYHIRVHNEMFVRNFIRRLSAKITDVIVDEPLQVIKGVGEQIVNYAHLICMDEVRGIGKDYSRISLEAVTILAATCLNIVDIITEHKDFIHAVFLTKNVPASTAYIPNMLRRTVVLSDTDSTMFSVDEWVIWYFGQLKFTVEAYAVASSIMFIATECIAHNLAILSANVGVSRKKLFSLAMKPEFAFTVFAQTSVAKHYFTCIAVKEGNVYKESEMEIKGVHLKSSAAPKELIKAAQATMREILDTISSGKKISIIAHIKKTADVERMITNSLLRDEVLYYKRSKIKNAEAYSLEATKSPYQHHVLWEEVFAPYYTTFGDTPYEVVKIPTIIENPTKLKNWVMSIENKELSHKLAGWLGRQNKKALPTMYVSLQYIRSHGLPKEIKPIVNVKKILLDLTNINRMILETLGYFPKPDILMTEIGY